MFFEKIPKNKFMLTLPIQLIDIFFFFSNKTAPNNTLFQKYF